MAYMREKYRVLHHCYSNHDNSYLANGTAGNDRRGADPSSGPVSVVIWPISEKYSV